MKAIVNKQIYRLIRNSTNSWKPYVHYHEEYELYFLLKGNATYYIGDDIYHITAGNFAFVPKGILHKTEYDNEETDRIVLYISESTFTGDMQLIKNELCKCRVIYVCDEKLPYIENLFRQLEAEYLEEERYLDTPNGRNEQECYNHSKCRYLRMLINLHIQEILIQLNYNKSDYRPAQPSSNQLIYEISRYISSHFQEPLSLKDLSLVFSISESHLSRKFRANTGIGIKNYITYVRINYAEKLLRETHLPITQVAERCGFNDSNYFSTVFKHIRGVSPAKYHKNFCCSHSRQNDV